MAFSNIISLLSGMFQRIVTCPVDVTIHFQRISSGIFQWIFIFVISGVQFVLPRPGRIPAAREALQLAAEEEASVRAPIAIAIVFTVAINVDVTFTVAFTLLLLLQLLFILL